MFFFCPGYDYETNLYPVQIYFDTRTFKAITKDEKATFLNQKAVIGEFTGLFLGLSFICFVEIFYFLILGLVRTLGKRVVKKQPVNEEDEQNENEHQEKVNVSIFSSSFIISLNNFHTWFNFPLRKRLLTVTLPVNNFLLTGTFPVNNSLLIEIWSLSIIPY